MAADIGLSVSFGFGRCLFGEALEIAKVITDNEWQDVAKAKPPLHNQVLVELKEGVGTVCDVATYIGKIVEDGMTVERWILADTRLESRQIKRWANIYPKPPANEVARAVEAAIEAYKAKNNP